MIEPADLLAILLGVLALVTYAVVVFTIVVQGLTISRLLRAAHGEQMPA